VTEYEPYDPEEGEDLYMKDPESQSIKGFKEALDIFAKYAKKGDLERFFCGAEHDIIYMYTDTDTLHPNSPDGKRLRELGFHVSDDAWAYFT